VIDGRSAAQLGSLGRTFVPPILELDALDAHNVPVPS